jgi:mono/diheme cytochrome c family protein
MIALGRQLGRDSYRMQHCKLQNAKCKLQIGGSGTGSPTSNLRFDIWNVRSETSKRKSAICILQLSFCNFHFPPPLTLQFFPITTTLLLLTIACLQGCKKDDMAAQPKFRPYEPTTLFPDGTSARPLVAGTVSRSPNNTPGIPYAMQWAPGPVGASDKLPDDVKTIPLQINRQLIARGQERFNIYCAVCHGRLGDGNGMIVQRGFIRPPSFHVKRLADPSQTPDAHFYDVISNGFGAMFSYSERVTPNDRWAITAYIRTLQTSVRQAVKDGKISEREYIALQGTRP